MKYFVTFVFFVVENQPLFIPDCWQEVEGHSSAQLACLIKHVEKKPKTGLFITIQVVFYSLQIVQALSPGKPGTLVHCHSDLFQVIESVISSF